MAKRSKKTRVARKSSSSVIHNDTINMVSFITILFLLFVIIACGIAIWAGFDMPTYAGGF